MTVDKQKLVDLNVRLNDSRTMLLQCGIKHSMRDFDSIRIEYIVKQTREMDIHDLVCFIHLPVIVMVKTADNTYVKQTHRKTTRCEWICSPVDRSAASVTLRVHEDYPQIEVSKIIAATARVRDPSNPSRYERKVLRAA